MNADPPPTVPTTVVAGILGVGKTTAILDLAGHRPDGARWVVLVNEFGEVGIDGAVLSDAGELGVRELPGGCLCCTARGPMEGAVRRIVAELAPDRLLVEPSGVADAGALLDLLTGPLGALLDLRATITLVDPRAVGQAGRRHRAAWQSQVDAADVLVGNRIDRCTPTGWRGRAGSIGRACCPTPWGGACSSRPRRGRTSARAGGPPPPTWSTTRGRSVTSSTSSPATRCG
jgi:G3E family GTPase